MLEIGCSIGMAKELCQRRSTKQAQCILRFHVDLIRINELHEMIKEMSL